MLAPHDAIVIGRTQLPVVNEGDALFHIVPLGRYSRATLETLEAFQAEIHSPHLDPEDPSRGF